MPLDPDDPRPPYQQVAADLRRAILTRRYVAGDRLPSGPELASRYGVARMTIQQALRVLREERLIVSRQGSGVFVRSFEPEAGVRHHLSRAFEAPRVSVDFAGYSADALQDTLSTALEQLRAGRLRPRSVDVRVLVPDPGAPWSLPGRPGGGDDPEYREHVAEVSARGMAAVRSALDEAAAAGLVGAARAQVRVHPFAPTFTLYLLNESQAFFAFAPVAERTVVLSGREHPVLDLVEDEDLLRLDDALPGSTEARYVEQARRWFDSVWSSSLAHLGDGS